MSGTSFIRRIFVISFVALGFSTTASQAQTRGWSGAYGGVNAGYTWSNDNTVSTSSSPNFFAPTWNTELDSSRALSAGTTSNPITSFAGGGQIGYNWQISPTFVAGVEADLVGLSDQSSSSSRSGSAVPADYPTELITSTVSTTRQLNHLGTVRARLGYLFAPDTMGYVTGGLAYGRTKTDTLITQQNLPVSGEFSSNARTDDELAGWTIGGGVERMLTDTLSIKAEYIYYDLGSVTNNLPALTNGTLYSSTPTSKTRYDGNLVRVGLNYHF